MRGDALAFLRCELRQAQGQAGISFALEQKYLQYLKALVLKVKGAVVPVTDQDLHEAEGYRLAIAPKGERGGCVLICRAGDGGQREAFPDADRKMSERGKP